MDKYVSSRKWNWLVNWSERFYDIFTIRKPFDVDENTWTKIGTGAKQIVGNISLSYQLSLILDACISNFDFNLVVGWEDKILMWLSTDNAT